MPPAAPARLLDRLRSALGPAADLPDARLVARYAREKDAAAFAELVRRHGPMVLAVCRRVVGDAHLAEDAFQATFLVLARKASAVRPAAAVGAFLHGVARRTALDARAMSARRRGREAPLPADPPAADLAPAEAELFRALDDEIARLPDHLRAAVVLCELEGRPRRAVADALGVPEGTLSSRLAKARQVLGERLRRRGYALPAALLTAVAVPPRLAAAAARLTSPDAVPPSVAALAAGVTRMILAAKLTAPALAAAVLAAGLALLPPTADARPAPQPPPAAPAAPAAVAKPAPRPARLLVWRNGHPALFSPDGNGATDVSLPAEFTGRRGRAILSPDGRQMAYAGFAGSVLRSGNVTYSFHSLWVKPVGDDGPGKTLAVQEGQPAAWSRDGKRLYGLGLDAEAAKVGKLQTINWVYDIPAGTYTALDLPKTFTVADESPDGRHLLADETGVADGAVFTRTHLLGRDGKRVAVLVDKGEPYTPVRFSPDGKRVLLVCQQFGLDHRLVTEEMFAVYDLAAKTLTKFKPAGLPRYHMVEPGAACWSPDGKRIAFAWVELVDPRLLPRPALPGVPAPGAAPPGGAAPPPPGNAPAAPAPAPPPAKNPFPWTLSVMDADGKNLRAIATDKERPFASVDWK